LPSEGLEISPPTVRQIRLQWKGDFEKLRSLLEKTDFAWAEEREAWGVVVTYIEALATDVLINEIVQNINDCGFTGFKTRSRRLGSELVLSHEGWDDFNTCEYIRRNPSWLTGSSRRMPPLPFDLAG
jgi:hypothetical protein